MAYKSNNNIHMSPEEICRIFTETALKPDKCIDFDIKYWIEKYDLIRKEPRFAEIAMLIMSAAQIYGRKVDYVEEFILNLCKSFQSLDNEQNKDGPPTGESGPTIPENRPRRRTKRMRPEMLSEKLIRTEYIPKPSKIVSMAKVTEKITITMDDENDTPTNKTKAKPAKRSLKQDILQWKINFPDETGKTKPRPQKLKIEEEELYSRYTNFGKSYLYDYEDDDVLGIKKDFKCFAGYIDPTSNSLLSDLNMRKFYKQQEEESGEGELYDMESMNQECDFLEDTRGGSPCRNESFFNDCPSMEVDTEIEAISAMDSQNSTQVDPSTVSSSSSEEINSSLDTTQNTTLGTDVSQSTDTSGDSGLSSTIDTSSKVIPQMLMKTTKITLKVEPEFKLNFLGLPEKLVRRKAIFALPKEMTSKKPVKPVTDEEQVTNESPSSLSLDNSGDFQFESGLIMGSPKKSTPVKEKLFINLSLDLSHIPTPPASVADDEEDFLGFDETPEFNDSDVFTSTLNRLSLDTSLFLPKVSRSYSQDSGFLTPPASLRFSCDEAGPSDLDSGLGSSSIDDDPSQQSNREKTNESEFVKDLTPPPPVEDLSVELTEKHKKLQDQAEKRHQERLDANIDVTVEVNKWHAYLKPILKASHARANFDIHELGTEILEGFPTKEGQEGGSNEQSKSLTITFADVVANKEQPDICRYFLSTLLLANTENIRLSVGKKERMDQVTEYKDMQLTFLSAERHFQEINEMYDDAGVINTNVKKRMREEEEETPVVPLEKTPKKQKVQKGRAVVKVLEQSPADSGYLSGFEEGSFMSSSMMVVGTAGPSRKRSISGAMVGVGGMKKKSSAVRSVLKV